MTVTEVQQSLGSWEIRLKEETPKYIRDALTYFGHIAVMPGEFDPVQYGDNMLSQARYVGVYRRNGLRDDLIMGGSGLAFWLGDEDDKGDIFEAPVVFSNQTFANTIRGLLPPGGSVAEGTLYSVAGTYSGKHQWDTPRKALTYVTDTFGAEWRLRGDAVQKVVLDAGTASQLYVTTPKALLISKDWGQDMFQTALPGQMQLDSDVEDLTTRVVLLAEGEGDAISTGSADAAPTPYKDMRGNPLKTTRLISESGTDATNATARAQLQLNRFTGLRKSVNLSTRDFDVKGQFVVGDYINVYDPENGFVDVAREVYWKGQPINPAALRCVEMTWPIPDGWTVGFRDTNGNWTDLTPWYVPESGETQVVVGTLSRSLTALGGEPVGTRPNLPTGADSTIPAAPVFDTLTTGSYQPDNGEWTKAAVFVSWFQPLNGDGSVIIDGGHYEVRYRVKSYIGYKVRWGQLSPYRWGGLSTNRWGAPITAPVTTSGEWNIVFVGWDQRQTIVPELTPGVEYEFQVRAVDAANPPKQGPWSASEFVVASEDLFAPDVPAAPVVASSRIALQVIHSLGKSSGGTFNLQPDLSYLSIHVGGSSSFYPDDSNEVGKLIATAAMIFGRVPAVGTFQVEQTDAVWVRVVAVDRSGNRSGPSEAVQATAELIDNAHISDLSVSKLTAGTITAQSVLAAQMEVGAGGNIKLTDGSLDVFNNAGQKRVEAGLLSNGDYGLAAVDTATGNLVDLATLAFGIRADVVSGSASTTAGSMSDIAGSYGPEVFVTVGETGRCLVTVSAQIASKAQRNFSISTGSGAMGFEMVHVGTAVQWVGPSLSRAAYHEVYYDTEGQVMNVPRIGFVAASTRVNLIEGIPSGLYRVTCKYIDFGDNPEGATFSNRTLIVQPF